MKHLWKVLAALLLVCTLVVCLAACGDDTPAPTPGGDDSNKNNGGTTVLDDIDISEIKLKDVSFDYDGELHKIEGKTYFTGKTNLGNRVSVRYEIWKDGAKVADGTEGVKDVGVYELRLIFSAEGYKEATVTSTLTINKTETITYALGLPTAAPAGTEMTVGEDNPDRYSTGSVGLALGTATLQGYKFKGWYTTAACPDSGLVTAIDGKDYTGPITLYAKFQKYVDYPTPYVYSTTVTEKPAQLPAIPGYDEMIEDSFKLLDMSMLTAESTEDMLSFKYQTPGSDSYYFKRNDSELTAGGQYAFQWIDYNDTFTASNWNGTDSSYEAGDGIYNGFITFYSPLSGYGASDYNTVEFWLYCANTTVTAENPAGDNIYLFLFGSKDSDTRRISIPLNFSGWKKFSFAYSDFNTIGSVGTIGRVQITANTLYGSEATLSQNKTPNFIYLSDMFLTNRKTSYNVSTGIGDVELVKALENYGKLTTKAVMTDAQVASVAGAINDLTATATTTPWSDLDITTGEGYAAVYERLMGLAMSWSCKDSAYFHQEELLNKMVSVLNFMTPVGYNLIDTASADLNARYAMPNLVGVVNLIGDYIEPAHAKAWLLPALYFFPSSVGEGEEALLSAWIYASANLAMGNKREAVDGFRQFTSQFSEEKLTLRTNQPGSETASYMSLLAAASGTALIPSDPAFINDMFAWFYTCIDSVLWNGSPFITDEDSLDTFVSSLRAMLLLYDMAPAATQNRFAATVKYYLAQNTSAYFNLETLLADSMMFDKEKTALDAIKANTATADTQGAHISYINESIGQAIYRSNSFNMVITADDTPMIIGKSGVLLQNAPYTVFKGLATDRALALIAGNNLVIATDNDITANYEDGMAYAVDGDIGAYIITDDMKSHKFTGTDALITESDTAIIVITEQNEDGTITCTVYNYLNSDKEINLFVSGLYDIVENNAAFGATTENGKTLVSIDPSYISGSNIYTFTLESIE